MAYYDTGPAPNVLSSRALEKEDETSPCKLCCCCGPTWNDFDKYWVNKGPKALFITIWIVANIAIVGERFYEYMVNREEIYDFLGQGVTLARGSGAALKLNCALMLVTVLRNFLSVVRASKLGNIVPVDQNIEFHKGIAWTILFWVLVHILAHFANYRTISQGSIENLALLNLTEQPAVWKLAILQLPGWTGHLVCMVMVLMYTSAISRIRRPMFEVFWFTHHLFVVFYGLLCVHGAAGILEPPTFWIWFCVPGLMYLIERTIRVVRGNKDTILRIAVAHPSKVLELQMQKNVFKYKPGQYLFLACPHIASHEWHPFTITSCPEEDFVSVHIRIVGDWTGALWEFMNPDKQLGVTQENVLTSPSGGPIFQIDGPFGTAAEEVFSFETVVLVGAGIGVTPFASILKSCRYSIERQLAGQSTTPIRKVYFYWVSRDKNAFEWFSELLTALEQENINNFLEIRAFLTGGLSPDDIKNVMYGDEEGIDQITGLESRTQFGRPDWMNEFGEIARIHDGEDIGVFFCGPAVLSSALQKSTYKLTKQTNTRFHYSKENF